MPQDPALNRALHQISVAEFVELAGLDALLIGQRRIAVALNAVNQRLARIERTVTREGVIMTEVDDRLAQLSTEVSGLADDVQRELADLANALSGTLSADQKAKFDALDGKLASLKDAVDQADPAPAPVDPNA